MMNSMEGHAKFTLKYALGPGLIMAAAAVGVSHLVQSTRAGADFGFTLVWAVILANVFKYPFLEFGPRYALATQESLIKGYKKLGNWAFWVFVVFTIGTMFIVQAAVTIVSASLAAELTGIVLSPFIWSAILLGICIGILLFGQYSALDSAIKLIMVVLTISTFVAIIVAVFSTQGAAPKPEPPSIWTAVGGVGFLIALMGWMPIPIDGAAWHSLWSLERIKQTKHVPKLKEGLIDFNIGYIGAGILALAFLSLGALIMYGSGVEFASSGGVFAQQLVSIYTSTLGDWAYWIIIICAFTTMFSTTLTVTDAYPRVSQEIISVIRANPDSGFSYRLLIVLISIGSLCILYFAGVHFTLLIDVATTVSFLTAPVLAYLNYRLVIDSHFPAEHRPPQWLRILSWGGILFLTGFTLFFMYWKFVLS